MKRPCRLIISAITCKNQYLLAMKYIFHDKDEQEKGSIVLIVRNIIPIGFQLGFLIIETIILHQNNNNRSSLYGLDIIVKILLCHFLNYSQV